MAQEIISFVTDEVYGVWFLIGAALVFWMQAGFAMCEAGFTRAKNAGNIIMKNLMRKNSSSSSSEDSAVSSPTSPDSGFETISKSYVYSAWYDVEKDNPVDYTSIDSNDAYALKCVFYFNRPVNGNFRAILNKDGKQISVKNIRLDGKVVCECDFSAGLEGRGTFEAGTYTVSLETEDKNIAISGDMRVN